MTWVTDLIENLPLLVGYIAPGFLLVGLFLWTASAEFKNSTEFVVASIVVSYLIWSIYGLFVHTTEIGIGSRVAICAISALVGLLSAILYKKESFNELIAKLGIKRTTNESIWDDVVGERSWIAIYCKESSGYYCGNFKYQKYEDGVCYIVMDTYYVTDRTGAVIQDYTQDQGRRRMFQISKYDEIIISKKDPFGHFEMLKNEREYKRKKKQT